MADNVWGEGTFFSNADGETSDSQRYRTLLNSIDDGVYQLDVDGQFVAVNDVITELTGYPREELLGSHVSMVLDEVDVARVENAMRGLLESGSDTVSLDLPVKTTDGDVISSELRLSLLLADGEFQGSVGVIREVTDRREPPRDLAGVTGPDELPLDDVLDVADVGVFVLDADYTIAWVNEATERYFGLDRTEILERDYRAVVDETIRSVVATPDEFAETVPGSCEDDADTGEFECRVTPGDGREERWLEHRSDTIESGQYAGGRVVLFYDVTDQKRTEQALREREQQFHSLVDAAQEYAVFMLDPDGRVVTWNDGAHRITGYEHGEIVGEHVSTFYTDEDREVGVPGQTLSAAAEHGSTEEEGWRVRNDGSRFWANVTTTAVREDGGDLQGYATVVRDRTGRTNAETGRELEQYRALTQAASDAIVTIDEESVIRSVNPAVADVFGYDPAELVGENLNRLMSPEMAERHRVGIERYLQTGVRNLDWEYIELPGVRADGTEIPLAVSFSEYEHAGERYFTGIVRDISERKEYERELERQRTELRERGQALRRAYETIVNTDLPFSEQVDELLTIVRETIGTEYATLSHVQGDEYVFVAVGGPDDGDIHVGDTVALSATNCERTVESERTLVLDDVESDAPELADRAGNAEWGISSYLGAPVFVDGEVYGTFCFYDTDARTEGFSDWEVTFVELLSNWVSQELERQRYTDRLSALNSLNDVVRSITDAVIEQSTREEIERTVCEALASTDSYEFAWIGEVDSTREKVEPRVMAGVEGYLDGEVISVNLDDPRSQGPTGRAIQTTEIQVVHDISSDAGYEPWREKAEEYGFRSSAAIPIVHEGTVYGVLNVYAGRTDAFTEEEQTVFGQLGEVVGHAIAGVERKQALTSDVVLELDVRIEDVFAELDGVATTDDRITIDQAIPVGNDEYLVYGTASEEGMDVVDELVEVLPHWVAVRPVGGERDRTKFELRLSEPPILMEVASGGGYVDEAFIEGGDYHMTLQVPPDVKSRQVVEALQEAYPATEMLAQRQVTRTDDGPSRALAAFQEQLTERQRSVLETAYFAGHFEWPRESTGEEIAASLDISPATFSQHLRAAENKVFGALFEDHATS